MSSKKKKEAGMDVESIASQILDAVGGPANIISYAHCATRLRLVVKDESLINKPTIEAIPAVAGTFTAGGQFQIILGPGTVNKVHDALARISGLSETSIDEVKAAATAQMNPVQRFVKMMSDVFVPLIPALVAAGLTMGLYNLLTRQGLWWFLPAEASLIGLVPAVADLADMIYMFANAAFVFLPVLIAFSAARVFGANPYLAGAIGMIMVHPALVNAWDQGAAIMAGDVPSWNLFGMDVGMIGYQGTVLPVLAAVWFLSIVERWLRGRMPSVLDMLLTPLLSVIATGFATLLVIGPAMRFVGDMLSTFFITLLEVGGPFAGAILGAVYPLLVITGLHHSFHAVELGLLADPNVGTNLLLPIWSMANVAMGGAAVAAWLLLRNRGTKIKDLALPSAITAFLGITEPAIFGVNLRLLTPFLGALTGAAAGGAWVVGLGVEMTAVGATGIPGIALVAPGAVGAYVIGMLIAISVAIAATLAYSRIFGFAKDAEASIREEEAALARAEQLELAA